MIKNKVSEIKIVPIKSQDGLVAFVNFIYDNAFYMSSIGIYTRPHGGFRLTYPIRKNSDKNLNVFFPINKEIANLIEEAVISKYIEIFESKCCDNE